MNKYDLNQLTQCVETLILEDHADEVVQETLEREFPGITRRDYADAVDKIVNDLTTYEASLASTTGPKH